MRLIQIHRAGCVSAVRPAGLALAWLAAGAAHADSPMVVDDAGIVAPGRCQLESWVRQARPGTEIWALPACNPGDDLELTVGGAALATREARTERDVLVQAKTMLQPLDGGGWGIALALGGVRHADAGTIDAYAYVPATRAFAGEALLVHVNLGWLREGASRRDHLSWGVGSEWRLGKRTSLLAETFGQDAGRPSWQAGVRQWLLPERLQLDATCGNRLGGGAGQRWVAIGLRWLPKPWRSG
ncbi:MAG: hypothetical protein ACOY4A_01940 [Pseudomonadota bacterium]